MTPYKEKDIYIKEKESELSSYEKTLSKLQSEADSKYGSEGSLYDRSIDEIKKKRSAAREKLDRLKEAGGESWDELSKAFEEAWRELKQTMEKVMDRMR